MEERPTYKYHLDRNDNIIYINEDWKTFALDNDGISLIENTMGKSIWSFISDGLVKRLYKDLIEAVRKANREINISFRCDSPEKIRFMEMHLIPLENGEIAFHNILTAERLKKEKFTPDIVAILNETAYPMCSHCNRIKISIDWLELEEALKQNLLANKKLKAHYGLCSDCSERLTNKIEELKDKTTSSIND